MVFGEIFTEKILNGLTIVDLVCVFSCFTNISVQRDKRLQNVAQTRAISKDAISAIQLIGTYYKEIEKIEQQYYLQGINSDEMHYELCDLMVWWCSARNEQECKAVFQQAKQQGISIGEFTKAILKINNIATEFEKVCTIQCNIELLDKMTKISTTTLKSIATNQSLYV